MRLLMAAAIMAGALTVTGAYAETPRPAAEADSAAEQLSPQDQEFVNAMEAAGKSAKRGPVDVPLGLQATLKLPAGYVYIPSAEGARLLRAMGNNSGSDFHGLVMPAEDADQWFITIDYHNSGYVRDEDAKTWNADQLLAQLKEGTEAGNADRTARGFPAIEVAGWAEVPKYDQPNHRLVWSALARDKGAPAGQEMTVNYNTYALGREGYYSLDLIIGEHKLEANKNHATKILAALNFREGKRYTDFVEGQDHVAEYGVAALVGGIAAKKLGLFALIGAFLLKGGKVIAVAAVGLLYGLKRLFSRQG